jgi:hypothetical protein
MSTPYSTVSPYYATAFKSNYLDVLTLRDIPINKNDAYFEVTSKYENRPDLLANDIYGDSKLWWVFAVRNKSIIKDPIYDLQAGIGIYIPQISTLRKVIGI